MNVPALALLTRSLRVESRSLLTYGARLALCGVILISLIGAWTSSRYAAAPGLEFFTGVVYIAVAFVVLGGVGFFSTCITEEKDDGTLGLLRMTDLSPVAILLGKAGGRLLAGILILLAQFPFTLLAITLGGISIQQITAAYVSLLAFIVLVAGVGLLVSVATARSGTAAARMILLAILYFAGPPLGGVILHAMAAEPRLAQFAPMLEKASSDLFWLTQTEIFMEISAQLDAGVNASLVHTGTIINAVGGLVAFLLAWLTFDLFNRKDIEGGPPRPMGLWRIASMRRRPTGRSRRRAAWSGSPAIVWKDLHFGGGGLPGMVLQGVLFSAIVGVLYWVGRYNNTNFNILELGKAVTAVFLVILGAELVIFSGRIFSEEVQGRTLGALVLLPISLPRIAYSKVLGNLGLLVPAILFIGLGACLSPHDVGHGFHEAFFSEYFGWVILAEALCAVHLVAFLSLYVRWAAIPVAAAVAIGGHMAFVVTLELLSEMVGGFMRGPDRTTEYAVAFLGIMILLGVATACHIGLGLRLRQLARD